MIPLAHRRPAARRRDFQLAALTLLMMAPTLFLGGCGHGEPPAAAASAGAAQLPPIEYVGEWGSRGADPGQLENPVGPVVDSAGRVYFADRGTGAVAKFETSGVPLLAFDNPAIRNAAAIAVDRGGGIYVADLESGRLQIFWPEGDPLRSLRLLPQSGFAGPFAFSVDAQGTILVPNPATGQIRSFDRRGRLVGAWKIPTGATGQIHPSLAIAAPDGAIFVGDAKTGLIAKYAPGGRLVANLAGGDASPAPLLSMAASLKYLFVLRAAQPRLEVWTLDGRLELKDNLGSRLDSAAADRAPTAAGAAIAVTPQGELLVLDPSGPRVLRFRLHLP